jgi:hypothetical protein
MRESFGGSFNLNGEYLLGINLGSDYCAEHEQGIEGIYQSFGCIRDDANYLGISRRIVREIPNNLVYIENKFKNRNYSHLVLPRYTLSDVENFTPVSYLPKELVTSWSKDSFGISVYKNKNYKKYLKEIYESFLKKDIAIYYVMKNPSNPFERPGLYLGITSKISEDDKKKMYELDFNSVCLKKEFDNSGIYDKLKRYEMPFLGLKPEWVKNFDREFNTSYNIVCYLNTFSRDYNSGWYTIEELDLWIQGVGPIPVNKSNLAKDFILRKT